MSATYTVRCLSTALSPITHMARTEGNEAVICREPVATDNGIAWVPCLSGNALRHKLVREPGARFLIERWRLAGALTMRQLNFLFHGGQLTESSSRQDTKGVAELHRLFPLIRLIGGSLPNAILPGSMICDRGILVCRENTARLRALVPDGWEVPGNLRPSHSYVEGYQYTRGDSSRGREARLSAPQDPDARPPDSNLMIFAGQSVIPGAVFWHGFTLQHVSELELGALLLSLSLWIADGGRIGGQAARGHGRLATEINISPAVDGTELVKAYIEHVDAVREEAVAWLHDAFAAPPPKPAKKPAAKKAPEPTSEGDLLGDATAEDNGNA